jgi:hypothetical protein
MELTKAELFKAVDELREYDHAFINPEGAKRLAAPFGVKPRTYIEKVNPNDPKGLILEDGATEAEGIDAALLAMQICGDLSVDYESKLGRGSQLRSCCDALKMWVEGLPDA